MQIQNQGVLFDMSQFQIKLSDLVAGKTYWHVNHGPMTYIGISFYRHAALFRPENGPPLIEVPESELWNRLIPNPNFMQEEQNEEA